MIRTVSDILQKFAEAEDRQLREYELSHGPTIGQMYEGLASKIVNQSIPAELGLEVVSGFITDGQGNNGPQTDCMLVRGKGEVIPYTTSYKYHVKDVIAVLEVKKSLYSADLADSCRKLRVVLEQQQQFVKVEMTGQSFDISAARTAFARITGRVAPDPDRVHQLPFDLQMIYHSLVVEHFAPVRIAFGFDGFKSETGLRGAFKDFVTQQVGQRGFGVASFPQLMISGRYAIAKLNGQPYSAPAPREGWWSCFASSSANPIQLMLEYIWTRLAREYHLQGLWGEDLDEERFYPCLDAHALQKSDVSGWELSPVTVDESALKSLASSQPWQPAVVRLEEFALLKSLGQGDEQRCDDPELIQWLKDQGREIEEFTKSVLATGLVALDDGYFRLITEQCAYGILPGRRYVAGENNTGRFARWFLRQLKEEESAGENS